MGRVAVAAAASLCAFPLSFLLNRVVPDPYMDEIFHVPQVQRYCRGDFASWDPMITTPPGLYCLSLAYVASLFPGSWLTGTVHSLSDLCSIPILRTTNVIGAVICSVLVHDLLLHMRPEVSERKATTYAIVIALFPIHWFFTFLYYTDVASLATVLAMYLASLKKKFAASAMLGALAILIRQTNAIWMAFVAANAAINFVEDTYRKKYDTPETRWKEVTGNALAREAMNNSSARQRTGNSMGSRQFNAPKSHRSPVVAGFSDEIFGVAQKLWVLKTKVLIAFAPFAAVLLAFAAFVIWNEGIVLGAKEAHEVSLHLAQLLYFGLFTAAASAPLHLNPSQLATTVRLLKRNKIYASLLGVTTLFLCFIAVQRFSIAHPYLLADNRHYTFYIWRKVLHPHWAAKYVLVPLYAFSWFSTASILGKLRPRIWVLSYVLAVALVLVPAPLIELRYFTVPFVMFLLNSPTPADRDLWLMGTAYAAVDVFTLAVFLLRPFRWQHEPGIQRFMW